MKNCTNPECKQTNPQPEENFSIEKDKEGYSWRRGKCKTCRNEKNKLSRYNSQEAYNAYMRKYNAENKHTRKWKDRYKNKVLKSRYGITLDQYNEMFKAQDEKCALCLKTHKDENAMPVDHDHTTGKVRGLLCHSCNRSLHWFDNAEMFKRAKDYVTKYKQESNKIWDWPQ